MRQFRFAYLLAALALVVFVRPFLSEQVLGLALVDLLQFVTLLAGAYAAIEQRRTFVAVAALGSVSAVAQVVFHVTHTAAASVAFVVAGLLFYTSIAWALLRALFRSQSRVTRDTLYQAQSVYLMIGLIGAMTYALLELAAPGSFRFPEELATVGAKESSVVVQQIEERFDRFLGFSFTTLTTLGYGNIAPASARADALTSLQAVIGQVYLAVVIARLVAIQVGQSERERLKRNVARDVREDQ